MKRSLDDLADEVRVALRQMGGKKYVHVSSNKMYQVDGIVVDEATNELRVIYVPLDRGYSEVAFDRPLKEWNEEIEINGVKRNRFERVRTADIYLTDYEYETVRAMTGDRYGSPLI